MRIPPFLYISLLAGCSGSPEKRAGRWEATSEFGDFTFVIDETGTMITHMEHDLKCKIGTMTDSFDMSGGPGSDLEDGKISLKRSMAGIPLVEWEGKFNASGTKASGTLWMFGRENCECNLHLHPTGRPAYQFIFECIPETVESSPAATR